MQCPTCGVAFHFQPAGTLDVSGVSWAFWGGDGLAEAPPYDGVSESTQLAAGNCPGCGSLVVTLRHMETVEPAETREVGLVPLGSPTLVGERVIFPPRSGGGTARRGTRAPAA